MQSNRRNLGILLIVIGLILLILVIYFGFFSQPATPAETETPVVPTTAQLPAGPETSTTTPSDKPRNRQQYDISKETAHQPNINDLTKLAMIFSNRFGSFSNQSDYGNFTDLKIYMTDSLKTWVDTYVSKIKSQVSNSTYYGIVTNALTTEVKSFDDKAGTADIIVTTERRASTEKIGGGLPYLQKLEWKFVKVNGDWLVNEVYWDK